mgnify:CR=1 FL=1
MSADTTQNSVPDIAEGRHNAAWHEFMARIISHLESTREEDWVEDVVRSKDGSKNCLFGHIFSMSEDEKESNRLWDLFECTVATTYMVYPVNDGRDPDYPQATPRQRCLAYLHDLKAGRTESVLQIMESMDREHRAETQKFA